MTKIYVVIRTKQHMSVLWIRLDLKSIYQEIHKPWFQRCECQLRLLRINYAREGW